MRTEQDRYAYSAITRRPPLRLPGGARVAFWVASNHEFYELDPPVRRTRAPWTRVQPDVLEYSHKEYGNRVGIWRLFELMDRLGLRASISLNVALMDHHPEITEACVARGWEFFGHGVYNTRYLIDLSEDEERAVLADVVATIEKHTGRRPVGWLSPALYNTPRTLDLLPEYGFLYTCDLLHDDEPFPVRVRSGRLISMPYAYDLNDIVAYQRYLQPPEVYGQAIKDQFDVLYAERAQSGRVMCVSVHPFLVCQPHRLRFFEEALTHVRSHDRVWFATGAEIAQWYLDTHYDEVARAVGHTARA